MRGHRHGDDTLCRQHKAANIIIISEGFGVSRKRTLHNIIIWNQELFSVVVRFLQPFQPFYYHSCLLGGRCRLHVVFVCVGVLLFVVKPSVADVKLLKFHTRKKCFMFIHRYFWLSLNTHL